MSSRDLSLCNVCKVVMPIKDMETHLNGKRHKKAASKAEALLKRKGDNIDTSENTLEGTKKCDICNVFVPLTAMSDHVNGKYHTNLESSNSTQDTKAGGDVISVTTSKDGEKCHMCNDLVPVGGMSDHVNTKKHKFLQVLDKPQFSNVSGDIITTNLNIAPENKQGISNRFNMCDICNTIIEPANMPSHINGKKHQKRLKEIEESDKNRGSAVQASGNSDVDNEIKGEIAKERSICSICGITVETTNMQIHLNTNRHQRRQKEVEEVMKKKKNAIKVTDYPHDSSRNALVQYFRQFGNAKYQYFTDNCYFVFYKEPFMAENALSTLHYFKGKVLTVERYTSKVNADEQKNPGELDLDAIVRSLRETGGLHQQLDILMRSVSPEYPAAIQKYKMVCYDLEMTLRRVFKTCQVHAFGSTITGLCFKDSDVDIYVQLPAEMVSSYSSDHLLRTARKALHQSRGLFNDIVCIFKAKTPIVKCSHIPSGLRCDFNFRSMLGVCNSRLIVYYLSLDYKITPLMIMLKFWGKVHNLGGSQKFTNYALTMMMIFYLQQPPFNLPAVKMLQTTFVFEQGGWNGGFVPLQNFQSEALRNTSLLELLKGFFKFYATFDFGLYVICPLVGEKVSKMSFLDGQNLPDDFIRYKEYLHCTPNSVPLSVDNAVCIQDPFQLTHNVTGVVPVRLLDWFLNCCKQSYEICESGVETNILHNLFTLTPKMNETISGTTNLKIRMAGSLKYCYKNLEPARRNIAALRKLWFETINDFLLSVLTLVLKLDIDTESEASANKLQRLEGQRDVHDNSFVDSIVFHCTGKYNLWEQRKSWLKNKASELNIPPDCSILDKEIALSNFVCEHGLVPLRDELVDFKLIVTARKNPTLVEFQLDRNRGVKSSFHTLCVFFVANIASWFTTYVHEKNGKANEECR